MPLLSSEALVLRHYPLRETSLIVSFFTREFGKVRAVARGARGEKSPLRGSLEPLSRVHIVFSGKEASELMNLRSCDLLEVFKCLWTELRAMEGALRLARLLDALLRERGPEPAIFSGFLLALRAINSGGEVRSLSAVFILRLLKALGYGPRAESCIRCGKGLEGGGVLSREEGVILCPSCGRGQGMALSPGALRFTRRALELSQKAALRLRLPRGLEGQVEGLLSGHLAHHCGVRF